MNFKKSLFTIALVALLISFLPLSTAHSVEDVETQKKAIISAIENRDLETTQDLLDENETLKDTVGRAKNSLLHIATNKEALDIVQHLVELKCDPNKKNSSGKTPLHLAAERGDTRILNILLKSRLNLNEKTNLGDTALHIAVREQKTDFLKTLLTRHDLNLFIENESGQTVAAMLKSDMTGTLREERGAEAKKIYDILTRDINISVKSILHDYSLPASTSPDMSELVQKIINNQKSIFLSYCWSNEYSTVPMVNDFERFLKGNLKLEKNYFRDTRTEPDYGMTTDTNLKEFMRKAEGADAVVIFLNPAYLQSFNCMFEFFRVWEVTDGEGKLKPQAYIIRHPNFADIFRQGTGHTSYTEHWEKEYNKVVEDSKRLQLKNAYQQANMARAYDNLQNSMSSIITFISDRIVSDYEVLRKGHFKEVLERALYERKKKPFPGDEHGGDVRAKIAQFENNINAIQKELTDNTKQQQKYVEERKFIDTKIKQIEADLEKAKRENNPEKIKALDDELKKQQSSLSNLQGNSTTLQTTIADLDQKLKALEATQTLQKQEAMNLQEAQKRTTEQQAKVEQERKQSEKTQQEKLQLDKEALKKERREQKRSEKEALNKLLLDLQSEVASLKAAHSQSAPKINPSTSAPTVTTTTLQKGSASLQSEASPSTSAPTATTPALGVVSPVSTSQPAVVSTTTPSPSLATASTLQPIEVKNYPAETRLTIPSWLKSEDEAIYQRFLNGALIYRPNPKSDDGKIVLPISALGNPLDGMFDLSRCGDTGNYLSISTGYRKGKKAENKGALEIWFAPRFLIEKELNTTAKHFQEIYSGWKENASVGIFWTWRGWDNLTWYDYLTTQTMDGISNSNLYVKWGMSHLEGWTLESLQSRAQIMCYGCGVGCGGPIPGIFQSKKFQVHFI